jgi:hypothetical protein
MKRTKQVKRKKRQPVGCECPGDKPANVYSTVTKTLAADYYAQIAKSSGVKRQDVKRVLLAANYTPPPAKIHHDEEWATADGRRIKVCDMEESHVRNALRMTIRRDRKRALDRISRIVRSLPMPVDRMRTHVVDRDAVEALAGDLALDYGDSQGDQ